MPLFRYQATGFAGRKVSGTRTAPHADALVADLEQEGLRLRSFSVVDAAAQSEQGFWLETESVPSTGRMGSRDAEELASHLAEVVAADLPLESGLAALAEDLPSRKMRRVLRQIVRQLDAGVDLEVALARSGAPPYLQAVVGAGQRSGRLGIALDRYGATSAALWGGVPLLIGSALYCGVVLFFWIGLVWLLVGWVLPGFVEMFSGFGLSLPGLTVAVIWVCDQIQRLWFPLLAAGAAIVLLVWGIFRVVAGPVGARRALYSVPGLGGVIRSLALCRFSVLLSLLVDSRVPLPESLRLAGAATGDAAVRDDAARLAEMVAEGEAAGEVAGRLGSFSPGFVRALSASYGPESLIDALQSLSEVYSGRIRAGLTLLAMVIPPLMMTLLGMFTALVVLALYLPLIQLLNQLS